MHQVESGRAYGPRRRRPSGRAVAGKVCQAACLPKLPAQPDHDGVVTRIRRKAF